MGFLLVEEISHQIELSNKRYLVFCRNTRAEFKRLKTILPSIKRKENVSKLDIILEAIKYIDDLQDQLFDRLTGTHSQREATLLALTEEDMERSRARLNALRDENNEAENVADMSTDDEESKDNVSSDEDSHHSLELWIIMIISKPHPPQSLLHINPRLLAMYKIHGLQRDVLFENQLFLW